MDHRAEQESSGSVAEAAYRRFRQMYSNSAPIRGRHSFESVVAAANLAFHEVSDDWLQSLDTDWVYGRNDSPFTSAAWNRRYRQLARRFR